MALTPVLALALAACTSVAFEGADNRLGMTPAQVANNAVPTRGTVVWGGRIVAIANLVEGTEIQVLAVPLTSGHEPRMGMPSQGRFVAYYPGFLEPENYAPGRFVTLAGQLDGFVEGKVGERDVTFPYVTTSQVHLWPRDVGQRGSRWNFGVGVGRASPGPSFEVAAESEPLLPII